MSALTTAVLFRLASALEAPLKMFALNSWAVLDREMEEPRGFSAFGVLQEGRETEFRAFGVLLCVWPDERFGKGAWGRRVIRTWLATITRWDMNIGRDDPRCGLFDFSFKRHGKHSFDFYGLGLHVLGSSLRQTPRQFPQ